MRSRSFLCFIAIFALLLLQCRSALAFNWFEHVQLGNLSLLISSNHFRANLTNPQEITAFESITREYVSGLKRGAQTTEITYGHVVMLVDYMRDPYEMLHRAQSGGRWPSNSASANVEYLQHLSKDVNSFVKASHGNHDHFQGRAVFSFWFWHQQALEIAKANNLYGALLVNAYADHFLQDLFAPGHVITPRDEASHDVMALMWHDHYNRRGMQYVFTNAAEFLPLVSSAQKLITNQSASGIINSPIGRSPILEIRRADLLEVALGSAGGKFSMTGYGDNRLSTNSMQTAIIALSCARSVLDIFETWSSKKMVNSFQDYHWDGRIAAQLVANQLANLMLQYGGMTCSFDSNIGRRWNDYGYIYRDANGMLTTNRADGYSIRANIALDPQDNLPLGYYIGMQSIAEPKGSHLRALVGAELLAAGGRMDFSKQIFSEDPYDYPWWAPAQWGVTLGYSGVIDVQEHGHGPTGRLVFPYPKANLQFSLLGGMRYYSGDRVSGWADFQELRVEWGMHLGNLFFGIGHDHYARQDGRLADGLAFQAGLSWTLPPSRYPKWLGGWRR